MSGFEQSVANMSAEKVKRLAADHEMRAVGSRPPFLEYLKELWSRRSFLWTLSTSKALAKNERQRFGQLWAVVNPILLIGTYFFIFGFLLRTGRGVDNFIGYLSIGVILYGISAATMTTGSRAILNNTGLVRALHFPRAILPISSVVTEFLAMLPGILMLFVVMVATGEPVRVKWLLLPAAILIHFLCQVGIVVILARLVNTSADMWNLIPVAVRVLRYLSGVFFSINVATSEYPVLGALLEYQPWALQLTLARESLMAEYTLTPINWVIGIAWAFGLAVLGLWFFWWDEARYGRG